MTWLELKTCSLFLHAIGAFIHSTNIKLCSKNNVLGRHWWMNQGSQPSWTLHSGVGNCFSHKTWLELHGSLAGTRMETKPGSNIELLTLYSTTNPSQTVIIISIKYFDLYTILITFFTEDIVSVSYRFQQDK